MGATLAEEASPLKEQHRYLSLLQALDNQVWCWGQMVRWLQDEQFLSVEQGLFARALGAALARAELVERHTEAGPSSLEAWADCAALLNDMSEKLSGGGEEGAILGMCVDGLQRGVDFVFG